jgi:hypothetical protein
MARARNGKQVGAETAIRSLAASPRLPAARQRRLDQLIDKSRESGLTSKESAELERMLEFVDRKSFWMLARALARQRSAGSVRRAGPRRREPAATTR